MQFTDTLIESYERHAYERASNLPGEFKKQEQLEFLKLLNKEQRKTILRRIEPREGVTFNALIVRKR